MASPVAPRSSSRRLWFVVVAVGIAGAVWYFSGREEGNRVDPGRAPWEGIQGQRPVPVRVVEATREDLAVRLKAIGTVTPLNSVTVRSRVDGQLLRIAFEEGQRVEKGQLLAEIDPQPYAIQLAQVEGQQQQIVAQIETARRDLERFRELHDRNLVTTQDFELQQSLVAEREGGLAAIQADVADAKLQLSYARIEAPIGGRLGLRKVDAGNLIRANDAEGLVMITQTQPIAVVFTVPEIDLQKVLDPLRAGKRIAVEAWDRNEQNLLATGVLTTVDNQIDIETGTLRIKAEFPNADERLFPNQFVNIRLPVSTVTDAVVIPGATVQHGSRGTYVFVIDDNKKATVRDVVLGPADDTRQSITQGLAHGEVVVIEGLDRLRDGSTVVLTNEIPPAALAAAPGSDS